MRSETTAPRPVDQHAGAGSPAAPVTYACLVVSGAAPAPSSLQDALVRLPWYHGRAFCCWARAGSCWQGACTPCRPCVRPMKPWLSGRSNCASPSIRSTAGAGNGWCSARSFAARAFLQRIWHRRHQCPDVWERWFARRHRQMLERTASHLLPARAWGWRTVRSRVSCQNNAGQWRWIMSRGTVAERDAQGRPVRLAGMDVDITAHHEVEDALRASRPSQAPSTSPCPTPLALPA